MNKLIVCIMGQNCEKFLPMCLESVKDADNIIFCEGLEDGQKEVPRSKSYEIFRKLVPNGEWIAQVYNQEDKQMNGKQRNFYLNYLKENFADSWALILDADEVVEDLSKIVSFIQVAIPGLYSPKMRHFIGDLGHEDATQPEHFVLNRLFKISEAGKYPETEHPVLIPRDLKEGEEPTLQEAVRCTTIWHLGYVNGIFDIDKKYLNHLKKSEMHTSDYLSNWHAHHILGTYPTNPINALDIPRVILEHLNIDKDLIYFSNKILGVNNFLMAQDWFERFNPDNILDLGCGLGNFGFVFKHFYGTEYKGVDISKFAVERNMYNINLEQGDIVTYKDTKTYDLVLCVDILEHLNEEDLDKALENIKNAGENFIFSIPYLGDPNLNIDNTHRIKQTKEWWVNKLVKYFVVEPAPNNWAFNHQLLIGRKI